MKTSSVEPFPFSKNLLEVNLVEMFPHFFVLAGAYKSFSVGGTPSLFVCTHLEDFVCTPLEDFVPGRLKTPIFTKLQISFYLYQRIVYLSYFRTENEISPKL